MSSRRQLVPVSVLPALAPASRHRSPAPLPDAEAATVVVPEAAVLRLSRRDRRHLMEQLDAPPRSLLLGHRLDVEA